ncbi:UNVERIFIED_CONTAM: hypothetical protein FKN15_049335 [Acipenser sinensis]
MNEILDLRRQVLVGHLTLDRMKDVKQHITARLDWGNEQLGLDLVPRNEFSMVDPDEISVTELYKLMEQRHRKKEPPVLASTHHLFVQMKSLMSSNLGEELEVFFSLYDSRENHPIRCNTENEWYQIQENIIRKVNARYNLTGSNAGEMRNDLYITMERGEFEKGGKSVARNVEITVYVLDIDGQILKNYVSAGSGEPALSEFHSFVLYHNNSPRWAELLKLPIPVDMFRGSHVRFEFRHCSTKEKGEKKLFGFSFVPLMQEDGRTLPDGTHELIVHKCEENANLQDSARYLKLPFSKGNLPGSNQAVKTTKESFWITSFLCSTKLTQNGDMLDLLKWRAHPERITDSLSKLKEIDGSEIVKFLQDTLDTLFGILDESPQKYGLKVFDCLVHIFNLLQDSKFQHFKPVMDTYIESHFAGALSYRDLIKVLKWYVDRIVEAEHQERIQQVLKSEEEFRCCVHELFMSIRFFLSQESKGSSPVTQTQAVFLNTFPSVYRELLKLFSVQEVANFIRDTLGSLPAITHADCPLEAVKLQCIAKTVESHLYTNPGMELFLETSVSEEIDLIVESLLGVLLRTILEITNRPQPAGTALRLQFQDVTDFLLQIFTVFRILIRPEMFPKDWTVMRLVTNNVIITTVLYLSDALRKNFLNENFDYKVEAKLIDKLDSLLSEGRGDETYRELFNSMLSQMVVMEIIDKNKSWGCTVPTLQPAEENREGDLEGEWDFIDSHCYTAHGKTVRLQGLYEGWGSRWQKDRMHKAAYTLLLYDELLEWSDRPLREFLNYPMQTEWQRKEYLHLTIIQNFDRGKNKEFVCRGHDYERLEAFQQRMLNEFPHAIAMQHVNQPDETIFQAEAQCILVEMSPLENAIEVIENKNLQLRALITQCQARQMHNINPLTMCLNGVIDAAVNGGLARYQEAFFVKDYIVNHPEDGEKIGRLRELMFEQAQILEYGLAVHEKFVPQDMRPLHKKLVDQFHLMRSSLGIQDFPAYVRASPVHFTNGSSRVCRNSVPNVISPDGARVISRRSPLSYPAVNRYSSSSLSSQASNEVSNITGQSESSDEVFNMQIMARAGGFGRRYIKAFVSGFLVAVPVTVTVLDRLAYVARVEGASMQEIKRLETRDERLFDDVGQGLTTDRKGLS